MATTMEHTVIDGPVAYRADGLRAPLAVVGAAAIVGGTLWSTLLLDDPSAGVVVRTVSVVLWAIAGALLARRARGPIGLVVLGFAASGALWAIASALVVEGPSGLSALAELVRPLALATIPAGAVHMMLALADGALRTSARRTTVIIWYVMALGAGLFIWTQRPESPNWPILALIAFTLVAGGIGSTIRYRRSRGLERQRLQWFGWSVTVAVTVGVLTGATRLLVDWPTNFIIVAAIATAPIPLALVAGSTQGLVSRIDRLLAATVAVGGLTGVVVITYLMIVLARGERPSETERSLLLLSMAAAMISALLYLPTRDRLTTLANRIVYGELRAPDEVLRTFGSRMSRAIPLDELLLQMAESLRKTFALDMVEVWTGTGGALKRTISEPDRGMKVLAVGAKEAPVVSRAGVSGNAWIRVWLPALLEGRETSIVRVAPIAHQGGLLGLITVERRNPEEPFNEENDRVLTELARQVGLALHNAQLDNTLQATLEEVQRQAEEIRASRTRIVAAGDNARRKLQQNLHDGAQQNLVALKVKLGLMKQIQAADPVNAEIMFEQLGGDIDDAIQALRDLAHGIYPPVLADHGLVPALQSAATKAALSTRVEPVGDVTRHSQEIEAAVYFCCLEALQNAGKHAGAGSEAIIHVRETDGALEFDVADNGAGFEMSNKGSGAGFVNMSDRLGSIGGTLKVTSAPGQGTTIAGRIPLN